jgi:large subunit ribosomal protein L24
MRLKRGDMVKVIAGKFKGQTGKIISVNPRTFGVVIEGLNVIKRAQKPSMATPQGGIITLHKPIDASKVAILNPAKKTSTSRIGYIIKKDGTKSRVFTQANKKEIDS